MRLWSLAPDILDRAALVACWREGLLAQKVLAGLTRGYTRHPQLERFRETDDPMSAIGHFLGALQQEATTRGYRFDETRITAPSRVPPLIEVTTGQAAFELAHLRRKVRERAPEWETRLGDEPRVAPSFRLIPGEIASWERP